ncbi:MAG: DUF6502 family protein [Xanthomonadales bacterium]|nr:DUF6502 family protein [Xanthomonadales bacterium]
MATPGNPAKRDIAILTRVTENVFRKLIRMLIGKMSLKKLQEMIQIIFIEEAEARLKQEKPGKSVALGDIALQTGVDTRTIKKIRTYIATSKPIHQDDAFLDGFMPLFKVFDLWMNDTRFFDTGTGKPRQLEIEGHGTSFSELVKTAIQSRGLTAQAVLKRLMEIDVVELDASSGTVVLKQEDNVFISKDDLDLLEVGLTAIGNLVSTVNHNIQNHLNEDARYFQRGSWDYQFNPENIERVRSAIHRYLRKVDAQSRHLISSLVEAESQKGQLTAGISMFYYEEGSPG